ncbi:hypothetical protein GLOTRDRAFT_94678 [Gloeophyllum trabeum ATCC 11539]|uniref:Uncharacterized protein n=1 Tax=Gloeophyllum trabeum (strain ATCC 11539 / FP-39264 / Madison 617) TaxID=670483 RepID=S7Q1L5_GLOTA|nr:uncharacterized protein GLOTRDRAFT_94678 [Gloeophyllum trabeum ATCC 11539]EPQ53417.1 hypothetical protein GLOTRDRAFT_94678 [Gloeophyllum trabeum ATCC 11539]
MTGEAVMSSAQANIPTAKCVELAPETPVHNLPMELLSKIFLNLQLEGKELGREFMPFILTHVCQRWRQCACSIPELWHDIAVTEDRDPSSIAEIPSKGFNECLQIWRACFVRCSSMRLELTPAMLCMIFPNPMELPVLESLAFINTSNTAAPTIMLTPRLTFFILYSLGLKDSAAISIPPCQLTELFLMLMAFDSSTVQLLEAQCSSLRSLALSPGSIDMSQMPPITFPVLEKASLSFGSRGYDVVLPKFIAPALRTLHVSTAHNSVSPPLSVVLPTMLAASGSQLEHLIIQSCDVIEHEEELYGILKAVPSLVFLSIQGVLFWDSPLDEVLRALVRRDPASNQFPVPHLEKLFINIETAAIDGCADDEGLSEVLDLRRKAEYAVAKLERVDVQISSGMPEGPASGWHVRPWIEGIIRGFHFDEEEKDSLFQDAETYADRCYSILGNFMT